MHLKNPKISRSSGFTLIQLSVMVAIAAVMLAGVVQGYRLYTYSQKMTVTRQRLSDIQIALEKYKKRTGFYPCVASLTQPVGTSTYARESPCNAAVLPGIFIAAGIGGSPVRIGAVPVLTLNLPATHTDDAWGRRLTYAISAGLADPSGTVFPAPPPTGAVSITSDMIPPPPPSAIYIIVSHGPDGAGGYTHTGQLPVPCNNPPATQDGENCNNDATFRYSENRSMLPGATRYDDLVTLSTPLTPPAPPTDRQIFNSDGTWIRPAGFGQHAVTLIQCWGAGGGGGSGNGGAGGGGGGGNWGGGGGGGGAYAEARVLLSTLGLGVPANQETVTIGNGGVNLGVDGTDGDVTKFGAILTVPGGKGGLSGMNNGWGGDGGDATGISGGVSGGTGGGGGDHGAGAGAYGNKRGGDGGYAGGAGGTGGLGSDNSPGFENGTDGVAPGGGGGGGGNGGDGGKGGKGRCIATTSS